MAVGRLEAGALEQHVHQRRLDAEHPDDAGDAAAAGEQAEGRLGQADLDLRVVDERSGGWQASAISKPPPSAAPLIAATTGLREGLEPAQVGLDRLGQSAKTAGGVVRAGLRSSR